MCSARAEVATSSFIRAHRCSASRCLGCIQSKQCTSWGNHRMVHSTQHLSALLRVPSPWGTQACAEGCSADGTQSGCLRVQGSVMTASERPLMYGKVRVVLGLWSSLSFLLLGHEHLCTKLEGYPFCYNASTVFFLLPHAPHQRMTVHWP